MHGLLLGNNRSYASFDTKEQKLKLLQQPPIKLESSRMRLVSALHNYDDLINKIELPISETAVIAS